MQQNHTKTAILIFVRSPLEEVRSKKWYSGAGYRNDLKLTALLNRQVVAVAKLSGLPIFVVSGKDQVGHTFGERFSNAIQSVFTLGFQNIITLGNDCPALEKAHLLKAKEQLNSLPLVIGPATDGGAYLIGINQNFFEADSFIQLPWQTADLVKGIKKWACEKKAAIAWLPEERDVDSSKDLKPIVKKLRTKVHLNSLLLILGYAPKAIPIRTFLYNTSFFPSAYPDRGPPFNGSSFPPYSL